jgi:hypothetical protein
MSRSRSRACKRRRRLEDGLREMVESARNADAKAARASAAPPGHGELWALLRRIEQSGLCVWDLARAIRCTDDEMAMIAQVVAPALAGMTHASVHWRHQRA